MAESKILPVRTSSDPNSAADINELSAEAFDKGGVEQLIQIIEEASPADDDLVLFERVSDGSLRRVKKSNLGVTAFGISFNLTGVAVTGTKQAQILMPAGATISKVIIYSDTQPTGSSIIVDVNINGVTIFTDQGKRPEIAVSTNTDDSDTPDITALVQDSRISVDVDQKGSGVAGGDDLLVTIVFL